MKHELQHTDSPTWCIHCGTFDIYCADNECDSVAREGRFDSRVPSNFNRMLGNIFGKAVPLVDA